jgi:hypothetical protein
VTRRVLNALDGFDEGSVRTQVPQNSVSEFRHQPEHPLCGVVHNPSSDLDSRAKAR